MPYNRMLAASSSNPSWAKALRGWFGLGAMASAGRKRTRVLSKSPYFRDKSMGASLLVTTDLITIFYHTIAQREGKGVEWEIFPKASVALEAGRRAVLY